MLISVSNTCLAEFENNRLWIIDLLGYTQQTRYQDSTKRDNLATTGIFFTADYFGKTELKIGYSELQVNFIPGSGLLNIKENNAMLGGKYHLHSDNGRFTLQIDAYSIEDESNFIDKITIIYPTLSYLTNSRTFYIDVGYSESRYRADISSIEDLDITQITASLGLSFNEQYDWVQVKAYYITPTQSNRLLDNEKKSSLEFKWIHWYSSNMFYIEKTIISLFGGERLYGVDSDTNSVFNLADTQTKSASISVQWKFGSFMRLMMSGGTTEYEDESINEIYTSKYAYLNVSTQW